MSQFSLVTLLHNGLAEMGMAFDHQTEAQMIRYLELIAQWNRTFNLSSIRDVDTMVVRHLLDSLSICDVIEGKTILDVGTGAGLPGIPLAIAMPDRQFVLLDSNQKKMQFLQKAIHQLRLRHVHVVHQRVEEYRTETLFDSVISRSFSTLRDFVALSQHLVKPGGQLLAMKGVYPLTELQEVGAPFKLVEVQPLKIPGLEAERHAVDLRYLPEMQKEIGNG